MNLKRTLQVALMLFCLHATGFAQARTNVVAVGNSITEGYGLQAGQKAWPEQLADLLGKDFRVINCGRSGTTMLKDAKWGDGSSRSYWNSDDHGYGQAKRSNADIVVIALGTNDAGGDVWSNANTFKNDYISMINEFKGINGSVKVYVCLPPYIYNGGQNTTLEQQVIPAIRDVAQQTGSTLINLHDITANHRNDLYNDDLHPNVDGAGLIARTIYDAVKNNGGKITPYVQNTYGDWYRDNVLELFGGDKFTFGPQPVNGGKWNWTGPNGFKATSREITVQNAGNNNIGTYHATYLADDGTVSGYDFKIAVDGRISADAANPTYPANAIADGAYNAFLDGFLIKPGEKLKARDDVGIHYAFRYGYRYDGNPGDILYCWPHGLVIMMLEDRYRFRGDESVKPLLTKILDTFTWWENGEYIKDEGVVSRDTQNKYLNLAKADQNISCWTWNYFNDDLLWMILPYIRCYLMTHQQRFLDQAKWLWDYLYERAWDDAIGGGYWWSMENRAKSGLSNNPAICLSVYLYEATGEQKYLDQAKKTFDWVYRILRDPDGGMDEHINIEHTDYPIRARGYNAYNAGTFIEGCAGLYRITGDRKYLDAAKGTMDWIITNDTNNDGLISRNGTYQSEFARGVAFLMEAAPELWNTQTTYGKNKVPTTYYEWMRKNADAAWNTRDTRYDISNTEWAKNTVFNVGGQAESWACELWVNMPVQVQCTPATNPGNNGTYLGQNSRITPYHQKNDGTWEQSPNVVVNLGDKVTFGPQPVDNNNWTWTGPNGFTASSREITLSNLKENQLGLYQATYVNGNGRIMTQNFVIGTDPNYDESIVITPYVEDKYGWQQKDVIGINVGEGFAIGPQANVEGTWSWTGPNGFKSYSREFSLANTTTAQGGLYTVTLRTNDGRINKADVQVNILKEAKPKIIPYMDNGTDGWRQVNQVSVNAGRNVGVGPQVEEGGHVEASTAYWYWVGPNGFTHRGRDFSLNNISRNESGTYTLYFNDLFGRRIVEKFVVTVDGYANPDDAAGTIDITETDINEVETEKAGTVYYDLRGVKVNKPANKGVFITNGKKVVVNK